MSNQAHRKTQRWHVWAIQIALLCLIALHSAGLLHKHATAAEHDACVACQIADHQALDVPDIGSGALTGLWVVLFLVVLWQRGAVLVADSFRRPPSRAPPFLLAA